MTNVKRSRSSFSKVTEYRQHRCRSHVFSDVNERFYESIDTPVSLSCYLLYKYQEFDQLVSKDIHPNCYNSADSFKLDFAAISFLRKSKVLKTTFDKRQIAISSFLKAEEVCKDTNLRFQNLALDPLFKGPNVWLLSATERKIARILKSFNPLDLFDNGSWGPGSSIGITGKDTSATRKFRYERQITKNLYTLVSPFLTKEYPNWFPNEDAISALEIVQSSKLLTVPKNAKTDRTIAIEPGLNTWFQKAVGLSIRRQLRRAGFDLNSDQRNIDLAKQGSIDNCSATIDFSAASDTISYRLVKEILPPDWFFALSSCRTASYSLDKSTPVQLNKFSSMGNGFTFELESLIFVAAALAVSEYLGLDESLVSVFGDDITIDCRGYDLYQSFTKFLGFTVNDAKSFTSSSCFRESCGSYFFNGVDVKPYFHKESVDGIKSLFRLANGISRLAHSHNLGYGRSLRFLPLHEHLVSLIPKRLRAYGSLTSGDSCIAASFDEATPVLAENGFEGYLHPAFIEVPVNLESDSPAVLLARLWYPSTEMDLGNKVPLRSVTSTRFKRILVSQWYDLGPWY